MLAHGHISEKISRDAHRIQASSWQYSYEPQSAPFQWIYLVILQVAHRKVRRKTREQQQHVNEVERNKVIPESWIIYLKREEQNICREHVQRSGWMPQFISLRFSRSTRQWEQGGPLAKFWQEEGFPHSHGKVLSLERRGSTCLPAAIWWLAETWSLFKDCSLTPSYQTLTLTEKKGWLQIRMCVVELRALSRALLMMFTSTGKQLTASMWHKMVNL